MKIQSDSTGYLYSLSDTGKIHFVWYYAEDSAYYTSKRPNVENLLVCPDEEKIRTKLEKGETFNVIAPYLPPKRFEKIFVVQELPNLGGVLTTQDLSILNSKSEEEKVNLEKKLIEQKTGLKIYKPRIPKHMMIGLRNIKRFISQIENVRDERLKPKAILLVGIPGTGKSFSAKYASSILDRYLVEFNLSKIIESDNPVFLMHSIFSYLEKLSKQGLKFIMWIDEIEKMFTGDEREKRIFGQFLTILNDLNTDTGYKIDGVFWITANDISAIMERNPEFLRRGRFDELFFLDAPLEEDAIELFELYKNYYGFEYFNREKKSKNFGEDAVSYTKNQVYSEECAKYGSVEANRFIYVPAEIQQIAKQMSIRRFLNEEFLNGNMELIELLYPKSILSRIEKFLHRKGIYTNNYNEIASLHRDILLSSSELLSELDLIVVLSQVEPLMISMGHALSKIRSNERFFIKAD